MYNFDVLSLLPPGTNFHTPYTLPPNFGGVVALSLCTMYWILPSLISWAHFSCVQQYFPLGIIFLTLGGPVAADVALGSVGIVLIADIFI